MPEYVLDTSAILGYFQDEDGSDRVEAILEEARETGTMILVSFISAMEIEYRLLREQSSADAESALLMVAGWPVRLEESDAIVRREAARIKAHHRLSVADSWISALAITRGLTLVHKDPEFDQILELSVERLPYKPLTKR